tara:strand:+ start:3240 stop:3596 length:357 start_codon:yes stop_codon:yes gene_type:complete
MNKGDVEVTLSPFIKKYMEAGKGTFDYIEEMIECCLNLLGEDGDFPEIVPSYSFVEWNETGLVLRPITMKALFDKKVAQPTRRHELYGLMTLLQPMTRKRFIRYLEEDLLERAFNGPN